MMSMLLLRHWQRGKILAFLSQLMDVSFSTSLHIIRPLMSLSISTKWGWQRDKTGGFLCDNELVHYLHGLLFKTIDY